LFPGYADHKFAIWHDAQGYQVEPESDELYWFQHAALYIGCIRDFGDACRSCRLASGCNRPACGCRADALDRFGGGGVDDDPRGCRNFGWTSYRRLAHQVFREYLLVI